MLFIACHSIMSKTKLLKPTFDILSLTKDQKWTFKLTKKTLTCINPLTCSKSSSLALAANFPRESSSTSSSVPSWLGWKCWAARLPWRTSWIQIKNTNSWFLNYHTFRIVNNKIVRIGDLMDALTANRLVGLGLFPTIQDQS